MKARTVAGLVLGGAVFAYGLVLYGRWSNARDVRNAANIAHLDSLLVESKKLTALADEVRQLAIDSLATMGTIADSLRARNDSLEKRHKSDTGRVVIKNNTIYVDTVSVTVPAIIANAIAAERASSTQLITGLRLEIDTLRKERKLLRDLVHADSTTIDEWKNRALVAERLSNAIAKVNRPSFLQRVVRGGCVSSGAGVGAIGGVAITSGGKTSDLASVARSIQGAAIGAVAGSIVGLIGCSKL